MAEYLVYRNLSVFLDVEGFGYRRMCSEGSCEWARNVSFDFGFGLGVLCRRRGLRDGDLGLGLD